MALDPNAFSPDSQTDSLSQQPNLRRQKMSALLGGKASLGSLFDSGSDTSGLSKSSLNGGETSSPLATPGLGAAEPAGSPSLLSTERVQGAPNFGTASPLLTGEQQAGAELGEAARGEEGVIGGGAGRQGLSTADRNRALMSFFHPQAAAGNATEAPQGASDTMKAVGSAKSAVGAAGKAKSLFGDSGSSSDRFPVEGNPFGGIQLIDKAPAGSRGAVPTADPEFDPTEGAGSPPPDSNFGLPDFTKAGTYGSGLGLLGSLASLYGNASGNPTMAKAGAGAGIAGQGVNFAANPSIAGGAGLAGAGLGLAGSLSGNQDVSTAGGLVGAGASLYGLGSGIASSLAPSASALAASGSMGGATGAGAGLGSGLGGAAAGEAAGLGAGAAGGLAGGVMALPGITKLIWDLVEPDKTRYSMVRDAANLQGQNEVGGLKHLAESIPDNNMGATYAALRSQLDPQGKVGTYFNPPPGVADQLGVPQGARWSEMTPQQFSAVMNWMGQDPVRTSYITGSGDIGYLDQGQAQSYAGQAADTARQLVARQLGLPYLRPDQANDEGNVASFMAQRDKWGAAHPGVAQTPYTPPKNYNPSPALLDLYQSMRNDNTL